MTARRVTVLGSTGSIGIQAADVVRAHPEEFAIVGLGAGGGRVAPLADQIVEFAPAVVAVADESVLPALRAAVRERSGSTEPEYVTGEGAMAALAAREADVVLNAMTGAAGLPATLAVLETDAVLALANKESLVVGGDLVKRYAAPGQIVPVDSEHSALAQCLRAGAEHEVRSLVVTATGGPFRGRALADLADVTPAEALAHPTWSMGPVISINSATMANKGLEVIEAHLLFDIPFDRITVVIHPQAYIHSMVEFVDGSTVAQVSPPDMRLPVALGLRWPERIPGVVPGVDWTTAHTWEVSPLDETQTPMVALARQVGVQGGAAPAVYNAANEVGVDAFLAGAIPFHAIPAVVDDVLAAHDFDPPQDSVPALLEHDRAARRRAGELLGRHAR